MEQGRTQVITEQVPEAWSAFYEQLGELAHPNTESEYNQLVSLMKHVYDNFDTTTAPYDQLFDYLANLANTWELEHQPELKNIDVAPNEVLAFLMEQHGVTQTQLSKEGIASQGNLSRILSGDRGISKELAKRLAKRFRVDVSVFI